jgi:uncharacterized protein YndB with AHSA1/START domain
MRRNPILSASSVVAAPPASVFAFLADPHNHWLLSGSKVRLVEIAEPAGGQLAGVIVIRGPAGIRRRARTMVLTARDPSLLSGVAELGASTTAWVSWSLRPCGSGGTGVVLSATVSSAGLLDRILLLAGGRLWIRRMFNETLERLGRSVGAAAPRAAGAAA